MADEVLNWHSEAKSQSSRAEAIAMLSSRLLVAGKQKKSAEVDRLWIRIVQEGLRRSLSPLLLRDPAVAFDTASTNVIAAMQEFRAMLATKNISILPGQRFLLMAPFGRFIQILHDLGRQDDIVSMMDLYPELGYKLTAKHWNAYVQALCNSREKEHQLLAWKIFSNVLLPYMPSLKALVRGDWTDPGSENLDGDPDVERRKYVSRDSIIKMRPTRPVPSHMTVVWLASVLQDFQELARRGDNESLEILRLQYPELLRRVALLPRHANRIQRGLLVGRKPYMSKPFINTKIQVQDARLRGITYGKSITNLLPAGSVSWSHRLRRSKVVRSRSAESIADDLRLAETALGEIPRNEQWLLDRRRWETPAEAKDRVAQTELEYIEIVDRMSRDVALSGLCMSETVGDPVESATAQIQIKPNAVDDSSGLERFSESEVVGDESSQGLEHNLDDGKHHKMDFDYPGIQRRTLQLNSAEPAPNLRISKRYDIISTALRPMKGVKSLKRAHSALKELRFRRLIEISESRKDAGIERRGPKDSSRDIADAFGESLELERFSSTVPDTVEFRLQLRNAQQVKAHGKQHRPQEKGRSWKRKKPPPSSRKSGQLPSSGKETDQTASDEQDGGGDEPFAPWKDAGLIVQIRDVR
jgi:hypothetical protein